MKAGEYGVLAEYGYEGLGYWYHLQTIIASNVEQKLILEDWCIRLLAEQLKITDERVRSLLIDLSDKFGLLRRDQHSVSLVPLKPKKEPKRRTKEEDKIEYAPGVRLTEAQFEALPGRIEAHLKLTGIKPERGSREGLLEWLSAYKQEKSYASRAGDDMACITRWALKAYTESIIKQLELSQKVEVYKDRSKRLTRVV